MGETDKVYKGKIIDIQIEKVTLPNGHEFEMEVVQHPGGAAVVALDEQGRVCLLRQYRHVAEAWLWELPAGKIDADEPPLETAQRELAEEAGLIAAQWQSLGMIFTSPGVFKEQIHLYLARELSHVASAHETEEVIEIRWFDFKQAFDWAKNGQISDAKTLAGILRSIELLDPDQ